MWIFGFSETFGSSNPSNVSFVKILWVKSWKISNNGKRYFHIDSGTSTDKIFALLHTVQSENENEIDELMNYSDT